MKINLNLLRIVILGLLFTACMPSFSNQSDPVLFTPEEEIENFITDVSSPPGDDGDQVITIIGTGKVPDGALSPESLVYLGAFRLPDDSGGMGWDYSGQGMTYYPEGDPGGTMDGTPGSLFVVGHDQEPFIAEISIPEPILSINLEDLNTALTLQPFADITGGRLSDDLEIPCIGIAYLSPQDGKEEGKLHFVFGEHFQEFAPSHGWSALDLSNPEPAGMWVFNGYSNYTTNDYVFSIPEAWADVHVNGYRLAGGRFREGVWGGLGPALFAYAPWEDGDPPADGSTLTAIQPLLLYGIQADGEPNLVTSDETRMDGYGEADHWSGGAWLTSPYGDAVIFSGTKALGQSWYGFSNGVVWDYDCAENPAKTCPEVPDFPYDNRGYWAEDFIPAILFFNPDDLAKVANGELATYEPQPYALLDLSKYLFDPETEAAIYKRDLVGGAAFDSKNGLVYIVERLGEEYKSVIHVFRISDDE